MEDHQKIVELEQRLEAMSRRVDDVAERAGQRIDPTGAFKPRPSNYRTFWGAIFVLVGFIWLTNRLGWLYFDIPIAATILIFIGLYLILTSRR